MDRNVAPQPARLLADGETAGQPSPAEKLLKYFPEAGLALYVAIDPLFKEIVDGDALKVWLWISLGLAVVLTWLYLERIWHITRAKQKLISCGALVLYVAAIGGPFVTISDYKTIYGTIAAVVATAFLVLLPASEAPRPPEA